MKVRTLVARHPGGAITPKNDWRLYAENAVAPLRRKSGGAITPKTKWRLYAGNSHGGSVFIDRELYVPKAWTDDRVRCEAAGIPEAVEFATKPQLARSMLERALDAGVPCGWVTGDEVYGGDRHLRLWLESRGQSFVMAVAKNEPLWWQGPDYVRADRIAEALPARAWRRLSAGAGAKGERMYDWALAPLWRLQITTEERRFGHYLLVRRSLDEKREHAYYVVYAPRSKATRQTLVNVAGRRWGQSTASNNLAELGARATDPLPSH